MPCHSCGIRYYPQIFRDLGKVQHAVSYLPQNFLSLIPQAENVIFFFFKHCRCRLESRWDERKKQKQATFQSCLSYHCLSISHLPQIFCCFFPFVVVWVYQMGLLSEIPERMLVIPQTHYIEVWKKDTCLAAHQFQASTRHKTRKLLMGTAASASPGQPIQQDREPGQPRKTIGLSWLQNKIAWQCEARDI